MSAVNKIIFIFFVFIFFTSELRAQERDKNFKLEWFSSSRTFPMSQTLCVDGECRAGGMRRNQIALTFDDGPHQNTLKVLKVLRQYNVPATFFVHIGRKSFGPSAKRIMDTIYSDGHKMANHGRSHRPIYKSTSSSVVLSSLLDTHSVIEQYIDQGDLLIYRNPGGYWSDRRARFLNHHNVLRKYIGPIFWNVGGENVYKNDQLIEAADWKCQQKGIRPERCAQGYFNKILSNYRGNTGSLVLLHDTSAVTYKMLPKIFEKLIGTGIDWEFIFVQDIPAVRSQKSHEN